MSCYLLCRVQKLSNVGTWQVMLNVSTAAIHMLFESQMVAASRRPVYGLTKNAGTMLVQQVAKDVSPDQLQVINFHPGVLYNAAFEAIGVKETDLPFDSRKLIHPSPPTSAIS